MDVLILRVEAPDHIVALVCKTNAVVGFKLSTTIPLHHMGMARTVTPFYPVSAKIACGPLYSIEESVDSSKTTCKTLYSSAEQVFYNCRLSDAQWPKPVAKTRTMWF